MPTINHTPTLSPAESVLIRESILLPSVLTLFERGLRDNALTNGLLGELYAAATKAIIQRIKADLDEINATLAAEDIRVDRESITETAVSYCVISRGCVNYVDIAKDHAKAEIGGRVRAYVKRLEAEFGG